MALDDATIADLLAKHGRPLTSIEASDGTTLVFKKAGRIEFDRWFDNRSEAGSAAARELAQSALVYPSSDEMKAVLDKQPGLLMGKKGILDTIAEMSGMGAEVVKKTL